MLFSYNWLNDYLQYKVSPQEISERLTMHAFEVESLTKQGNDWILEIDVLPNRAADAFCHQGVAREINALAGFAGTFQKKEGKAIWELGDPRALAGNEAPITINVQSKSDCSFYQAMVIDGVRVGPSPVWLKERLAAVGIDSITNIVDISNYVMLDMGQPTHVFDAGALKLPDGRTELMVRRAANREVLELLGGTKVLLNQDDIIIANASKALALAGIKGGQASSVTKSTQSVLIEAALFNRQAIYQTVRRLGLPTQSAKRFSAGIAEGFAPRGLFAVARLIQEMAGGTIAGHGVFEGNGTKERPFIMLSHIKVEGIAGEKLSQGILTNSLFHLGFEVQKEQEGVFKVYPPFWRTDCQIPEDLVEEVLRLRGFDGIASVAPRVSLTEPVIDDSLALRSFARRYFTAQGFDEVYSYSLTSMRAMHAVELLNPASDARAYLRESLIPGLLENVAANQGLFHVIKMLEFGKVFRKQGTSVEEKEHIAGVLFGKNDADFRELRGSIEGLLEAFGFDADDYFFEHQQNELKRSFLSLSLNGQSCGFIEVPLLPPQLKIKGKVVAFEIDAEALFSQVAKEREFAPPPKFPAVVRDISLLLPSQVNGDSVIGVICEVGKDLIEDVDLFDVYEEPDREGRSLAFHIIYRSKEKTLTDREVSALHHKIENQLTEQFHAQIR